MESPRPQHLTISLRLVHHVGSDDRDAIRSFVVRVDDLTDTRLPGAGPEQTFLQLDAHWSNEEFPTPPRLLGHTATTPTDDALAAHQRKLRFFLLQGERVELGRVRGIVHGACRQAGSPADLNTFLKSARKAWNLDLVQFLGCPVAGHKLLLLWFHGSLFHDDADKRSELDAIRARGGEALFRSWLLMAQLLAQHVLVEFADFLKLRTDLLDVLPA